MTRLNAELDAIRADLAELRAEQARRDSPILTGAEVAREFAKLKATP